MDCLEKSSASSLKDYQSRNFMKKIYTGLNPLLLCCINPSGEVLRHVLNCTM